MTKKDYEQIAMVLWLTKPINHGQDPNGQWQKTISVMGMTLQHNNPKFDIFKFNGYCHGGKDWDKETPADQNRKTLDKFFGNL